MDSAEHDVVDAFRKRGVEVRNLSHDQQSTDLEKALVAAKAEGCCRAVIAGQFAGINGRLDHTFGIANALLRLQPTQDPFLEDCALTWLLNFKRIFVEG